MRRAISARARRRDRDMIEYPRIPVYVYLLPLFALLATAEVVWHRRRGDGYPWKEGAASLGVFALNVAEGVLPAVVVGPIFAWVHVHRIATLPLRSWHDWVLLVLALELAYYWMHRGSHHIRWMWASHAVHHSATRLTLPAAARLPWTSSLSGMWLFWLPLVWLGFDPFSLFLVLGLNQAYQVWIHTELVPKLGPLEWILNTPSHHRVHHALNDGYVNRNYGGVLIVFDRVFGTFAAEPDGVPLRYGLFAPPPSQNPLRLSLHEWERVARDVWRAGTWRARLRAAFGPVGG